MSPAALIRARHKDGGPYGSYLVSARQRGRSWGVSIVWGSTAWLRSWRSE